ncbi:hypothetical protein BDW72DRAFT_65703 [Aspergillus terricola var. indicus]
MFLSIPPVLITFYTPLLLLFLLMSLPLCYSLRCSYEHRPDPRIPRCSVTIIPVRTRVARLFDV